MSVVEIWWPLERPRESGRPHRRVSHRHHPSCCYGRSSRRLGGGERAFSRATERKKKKKNRIAGVRGPSLFMECSLLNSNPTRRKRKWFFFPLWIRRRITCCTTTATPPTPISRAWMYKRTTSRLVDISPSSIQTKMYFLFNTLFEACFFFYPWCLFRFSRTAKEFFIYFFFLLKIGKKRAGMTHIDVLIDDNDDELLCFLSSYFFFFFLFDTTRITPHSRRPKREKD